MSDFTQIPDYGSRQLFLDGAVTVQRFEDATYPKLQQYEKMARGFYWTPEEIDVSKDKADHAAASDALKFIFTQNILRQTTLDSIQGRTPAQIFTPVASVPELEALVQSWSFFETNIHSNSYSHIVRNIYSSPVDEFNSIHSNQHILSMAANVSQYYEDLHVLNCKKALGEAVTEEEHIDAIWMALNASYGLEAIRFTVSFSTSFAMIENKMYMGGGSIISLIAQDEFLHADWTAYLINTVVRRDPRFAAAKVRCEQRVLQLYLDVIREEKEWATFLFQKGSIIGVNAAILQEFVDYTATYRFKDIGLKYNKPVKHTPLPWFNKHIELNRKQVALQEVESTDYVVFSLSDNIDFSQLPTSL